MAQHPAALDAAPRAPEIHSHPAFLALRPDFRTLEQADPAAVGHAGGYLRPRSSRRCVQPTIVVQLAPRPPENSAGVVDGE